jgi:hypothetical protein
MTHQGKLRKRKSEDKLGGTEMMGDAVLGSKMVELTDDVVEHVL